MESYATQSPETPILEVLLVDDHEATRYEMTQLIDLEPDLSVVAEAPDAEHSLQLARDLRPAVVVMDLALPGMSGIEATRAITEANPKARVLVLSNHVGRDLVESAMEAGATGYVRKDRAFEELLPAIRAVAHGEEFLGEGIT